MTWRKIEIKPGLYAFTEVMPGGMTERQVWQGRSEKARAEVNLRWWSQFGYFAGQCDSMTQLEALRRAFQEEELARQRLDYADSPQAIDAAVLEISGRELVVRAEVLRMKAGVSR